MIAVSEIGVGQPATREIVSDTAMLKMMPATAPHEAQKDGLGEELQQRMQAARADRHAQPDFARAFGHRDQQDVDDADAIAEERN